MEIENANCLIGKEGTHEGGENREKKERETKGDEERT